jgi:hypothetical protein
MQDVPARYLAWLWGELQGASANVDREKWLLLPEHSRRSVKVANYIFNSKAAIELEIGEKI